MTDSEEANGNLRFEVRMKDRPSKIRRPGGGYRKISKIICLNAAFVCLGLCTAYVGPCILDLQLQTGATIGEVARVFVGRAAGTMAGSTVGLLMTDSVAGWHATTTLALASLAVGIAVVPWCRNLPMLVGVFVLQGSATGLISSRCGSVCQQMWGRTGSNQQYVVHLSYGIGALAAPLLVERFIVDRSIAMPNFHNSQPASSSHRRARRDAADLPSTDETEHDDHEMVFVASNMTLEATSSTNVLLTTEADGAIADQELGSDFTTTRNADSILPGFRVELGSNLTIIASTAVVNTTIGLLSHPGASPSSSSTTATTPRPQKPIHADAEHLNPDSQVASGKKYREEIRKHLNDHKDEEDAEPVEPSPSSTTVWNNTTLGISTASNDTAVDVVIFIGNSTSQSLSGIDVTDTSDKSFSTNRSESNLDSSAKNVSSSGAVVNSSDGTQHSDDDGATNMAGLTTESAEGGIVDHTDVEEQITDVKSSLTPGPPSVPSLWSVSSTLTPGPPSLPSLGSPSSTPTPAAVTVSTESSKPAFRTSSASSSTKNVAASAAGTSKSTKTNAGNPVNDPTTTLKPVIISKRNMTKISDDDSLIMKSTASSLGPSTVKTISTSTVRTTTLNNLKPKTTISSSTRTSTTVVSSTSNKLALLSTTTVAMAAAPPSISLPTNMSVDSNDISRPSSDQLPQLSSAYWIIAVFVSLAAAMFAILWCTSPGCCRQHSRRNGAADWHLNDPTGLTAAALSTIIVLHFFHVGSESTISGLLSYFAGSLLGWNASASVLLLVGFWTAFAATRLACVVVASRLRPWPLMFGGFTVGLMAVIGIVLGVIERSDAAIFSRFHSRSAAIWTGSVLLGLGCALVVPAGVKFFTSSRRLTIAVTVGSTVGDILVPVVAAILTDVYDSNWIIYTVFASAAGGVTICTVLRCVVPPPSVTCRHVRLLNPAADDLEGTMTDTNGEEEAELLGTECNPAEISVSESMTAILPSPSLRRNFAKRE